MIDFFLCSNKYRIAATNTINLSLRVYYIPSFSIAPSLRGDLMRRFTFYAASVYRSSYFRWFPPISTIWNLCTFSGFYMCLCHTDWESVESTHLNFFLWATHYFHLFTIYFSEQPIVLQWNVYSESRLPIHFIHFSFSAHFNNEMYQNAVSKHRILLVAQDAINFRIQNRNHSKYSIFTSFIERMR